MKTISRYIMTLVLLITAATGAWAQTQWESGDCTVTLNNGTLTVSGNGAMADYFNSSDRPWHNNRNDITSVVVESGVTSVRRNAFESFTNLTSVTLPEGLTAIGLYSFSNCSSLQSITIPSTVTSIGDGAFDGCSAMTSVTLPEGLTAIGAGAFSSCSSLTSITIPSTVTSIGNYAFMSSSAISDVNLYANPDNLTWGNTNMNFKKDGSTKCHVLAEHLSTYQNNFSSVNVTFVGDLEPLPTPIEVTTNAASKQDLFTEAKFNMPASDATVNYMLVRDMGYKVAFSGVPTRARLAKDGNGKFHFADGLTFQLLDNIDAANPKDITSAEGITFMVGEMVPFDFEGRTFYQLDKETLVPLANFLADAHLGTYVICAVASTGEYDGSFSSDMITLFQGYEVTVPAGEYATFYKDENLYTEDENAELYTIASVTDTEAVLSDAIKVAPANTPLLVYNKSQTETLTFLLIPTTDKTPDNVTAATQFVGTLEATTIPASATGADNYALNGYAFVWVKNAIEVGANKCWLHIASQPAAARAMTRSIVGGNGTTGIDAIENVTIDNEGWYDLQGRKLQAKPNRGGIYIHNGKKVVIR